MPWDVDPRTPPSHTTQQKSTFFDDNTKVAHVLRFRHVVFTTLRKQLDFLCEKVTVAQRGEGQSSKPAVFSVFLLSTYQYNQNFSGALPDKTAR